MPKSFIHTYSTYIKIYKESIKMNLYIHTYIKIHTYCTYIHLQNKYNNYNEIIFAFCNVCHPRKSIPA